MNVALSKIGFITAVLGLIALISRDELLSPNPFVIAVQVVALLFMISARITFGMRSFHAAASTTEGELVTRGPFAIVRNPIYASMTLFAWAGIAVHLNLVSAALGLLILVGMLVRIFAEERELRKYYGDSYAAYCKRVKRLLPGVF
jgi:protein-S-isoprenylcysteine O-methyltransferase Ste14